MRLIILACALMAVTLSAAVLIGVPVQAEDDPVIAGYGSSDEPQSESIEDLPANMRQRIEALYAARNRKFTVLDGILEEFAVTDLTVPEAVAKLSNDHNVLCGIEVVPWPPGSDGLKPLDLEHISISLVKKTPREILDSLTVLDPTFTWTEDKGIANLMVRSAYESPEYPLNIPIPEFRVNDRPYTMVFGSRYYPSLFVLPQIVDALKIGSSGRWPRELEPKLSLDTINMSARQITNQVAREVGMSWWMVACKTATHKEDIVWFHMLPKVNVRPCGGSNGEQPPGRPAE